MPSSLTPSAQRIPSLDALRGLALGGILVVNITQLAHMYDYHASAAGLVVDLAFHQRFFPIFSFLFGIGFAIFLESAERRAGRPRVALLRRLAILAAFGAAHHVAQPGEALLPYAIFGALFLLPASYLPRVVVLGFGAAMAVAALVLTGGGLTLIPGLFLLGMAVARFGLVRGVERRTGPLAGLLAAGLVIAVPMVVWYVRVPVQERAFGYGAPIAAVAGLAVAAVYVAAFLLLLRTRPGAVAGRVLAPLGRMALTNYVTATAIVLVAIPPLGLEESRSYGTVFVLAVAIIAVQAVFSAWWLGRWRYGPLEWVWRCGTWWQVVPNKLDGPAGAGRTRQGVTAR